MIEKEFLRVWVWYLRYFWKYVMNCPRKYSPKEKWRESDHSRRESWCHRNCRNTFFGLLIWKVSGYTNRLWKTSDSQSKSRNQTMNKIQDFWKMTNFWRKNGWYVCCCWCKNAKNSPWFTRWEDDWSNTISTLADSLYSSVKYRKIKFSLDFLMIFLTIHQYFLSGICHLFQFVIEWII